MSDERAPDEFEQRIRALEAERLRPVPPPPTGEFERKIADFENYLRRLGRRFYPESGADDDTDHDRIED